ncbi:hypothetical protein [Dactylosporangium sp. NPDC048998]|uniref:hypothetical protein n=1 Tax=Dactylosporangium sp. NPDC048998 TaxID=3363976 RepID=UPI00372255F9
MAPPTPQRIAAGIAALRDDAAAWLTAAAAMSTAATAAPPLDGGQFSALGDLTGLAGVHAELRHTVATLLAEAARTGAATAAALYEAADGYERDERAAVHLLRGIW